MTYAIFIPVIVSFILFIGVLMVAIPLAPALSFMFTVALSYGFFDGFNHLSPKELSVLAIIWLISVIIDLFAGVLGAKYGGAGWKTLAYGLFGAFIGTIILPPFGGLLGLFMAILISEFFVHGIEWRAFRAAGAGVIGAFAGMLVNGFLALLFLILFILFVF